MERDLAVDLLAWKNSPTRKPLLLQGARQVGKTFLLKKFGEHPYSDCAYFNFETDPRLKDFFSGKLDPKTILENLAIYRNKKIIPEQTLVILDEIQVSDKALTSLKYFCEEAPQYHIAAAGSLLGVQLSRQSSFPVGKVNFLYLYPLNFFEFLSAIGKTGLRNYLQTASLQTPIPEPFHQELLEILRKFFLVGGMPEAVRQYAQELDWEKIRTIQNEILKSYQLDFAKYASPQENAKISLIWDSLPRQLAKENKKFKFSDVKTGARAREFEAALQWLVQAGLTYLSHDISAPKFPLSAYHEADFFKVFLLDVGLLGALSQLMPSAILEKEALFQEFNGAMTENFVAQELIPHFQRQLYYWTSPGTAEIDFVLAKDQSIFPLEVKAGRDKRKRSLKVYEDKYRPKVSVRTSPRNLQQTGSFINIPLYLIGRLNDLVPS